MQFPSNALVLLIGPSGAGKTTWAKAHFGASEIFSADQARIWLCGDESNQALTGEAWALVKSIVESRLKHGGLLTCVDGTNLKPSDRTQWRDLAAIHGVPLIGVLFNMTDALCRARNAARLERVVPEKGMKVMLERFRQAFQSAPLEQWEALYCVNELGGVGQFQLAAAAPAEQEKYDIIGDVHGCAEELKELLGKLGYGVNPAGGLTAPEGRKLVFVGDLCDRGPESVEVLALVQNRIRDGMALAVRGNHDDKLLRWMKGRKVTVNNGLEVTIADPQLAEGTLLREATMKFLESLPYVLRLDHGRLIVVHGAYEEDAVGEKLRSLALYGKTTGEKDENGFPERLPWEEDYTGSATVVHGHVALPCFEMRNKVWNIDSGCVHGGTLTALKYPEMRVVQVKAKRVYWPREKETTA